MSYPNLLPILPEIFIALMIIILLLVDAFSKKLQSNLAVALTIITLLIAALLEHFIYTGSTQLTFNHMVILDALAVGTKELTLILAIITVIYIKNYLKTRNFKPGEFYSIFLFAVLGMLVMISANHMLVLYVGLELFSLALYGLIALNRDELKSIEAAMKYFILGALASGLLLYGISFIYGATGGALGLEDVLRSILNLGDTNQALLGFGLVFIVAGLVFKLGLVPFHLWIPDVYEGSPLGVTTIIGALTKLAAVVFVIRFLVGGLVLLNPAWSTMLWLLACLSLFFGNILAIAQNNLKRLLGYSTIAHMGFVALGLTTVNVEGVSATLFYIITYSITALAGFGILTQLSQGDFECENMEDLKGLSRREPVYAGLLLLVMFSMAGIPPLVGFYAKFKILSVLVASGYVATAVFAVIMSLIGAYYYIRIVKYMYFDEAKTTRQIQVETCKLSRGLIIANSVLLVIIGIFPSLLMYYCLSLIS